MLAAPPELALAQQNILSGRCPPIASGCDSQPPHPLLHPLLPNVGVNLGGTDALVAEQRLNVHPFRPGVEEVGGVSMPEFVRKSFFRCQPCLASPAGRRGRLATARGTIRMARFRPML